MDKFSFSSSVVSTVKKVLQICPLGSVVFCNSVSFNRLVMQSEGSSIVMKKLDILLQYLVSQKIFRHSNADNARAQYHKLLEEVKNPVVVDREFLDEIFFKKASCCKYDAISLVIKILLTIIHG